jgi:hypothetical protein
MLQEQSQQANGKQHSFGVWQPASEPLLGESGWLTPSLLHISSFEEEEYLVLSAITDAGTPLEGELCQKPENFSIRKARYRSVAMSRNLKNSASA